MGREGDRDGGEVGLVGAVGADRGVGGLAGGGVGGGRTWGVVDSALLPCLAGWDLRKDCHVVS